ncbi:MFS transporter [Saccharibacter floricola]|uniref:MFS transporter n=1 Tax=Saccharibacter floricola TaxID=231053 RepID=UPI000366A796|nr:MFS transporter [Saccharibacter floricola]
MPLLSSHRSISALILTTVTTSLTDNMMKTFVLLHLIGHGRWVGAVATLSFVLPYLILSPLAGSLGDHFPRTRLLQCYKYSELVAVLLSSIGILTDTIPLMLSALLAFGVQITLISPVKLGLLPDLTSDDHLVTANGLLDGATFMAILAGTALASLLPPIWICVTMLGMALIGIGSSLAIRSPSQGNEPINIHWLSNLRHMIYVTHHAGKLGVALLLSLFWGVASALVTLIPSFMHHLAQHTALPLSEPHAASVLMLSTTLTLGVGALCAGLIPNSRHISTSLFIAMLLASIGFFCNLSWSTDLTCLILGGFAAGLCSSQFYAHLIERTQGETSTISAGNNILNAIAMSIASLLLMLV